VVSIEFRLGDEVESVAALMRRFAEVPMSMADACLVRMTELAPDSSVLTLDSDFTVYRRNRRQVVPVISPWS
jgi:predicted nucleic acid-binding protein